MKSSSVVMKSSGLVHEVLFPLTDQSIVSGIAI